MGMVRSNQSVFTSPAHLIRAAIAALRLLLQPSNKAAPAPLAERAYDPVIDWEQDLAKDPPLVSEADQWFLLVMLWWIATVMAAAELGVL